MIGIPLPAHPDRDAFVHGIHSLKFPEEPEFSARELILEYHERWDAELAYDEQKAHQDPCRAERTTNLRSETADGLRQELHAPSLAYFVVSALMLEAATSANLDVDCLPFKGSFQILKTRLPECDPGNPVKFSERCAAVVREISRDRIPPRRTRINPCVTKRKMARWDKRRPRHRKQPPLLKRPLHRQWLCFIERYCFYRPAASGRQRCRRAIALPLTVRLPTSRGPILPIPDGWETAGAGTGDAPLGAGRGGATGSSRSAP